MSFNVRFIWRVERMDGCLPSPILQDEEGFLGEADEFLKEAKM